MLFAATSRNAPELLAVLLAAALAAACGGRGGVLHDVLDEAEERVNLLLEGFEDAEDEMNEAVAMELLPCPDEYEPPRHADEPPPFMDVVDRPAEISEADEAVHLRGRRHDAMSILTMSHKRVCLSAQNSLDALPRTREQIQRGLEGFSGYADAVRDFINEDMSDEDIESLSAEVNAIAPEARPDDDDPLQLRYDRLIDRVFELSPLVRAMGGTWPGAQVQPGVIPPDSENRTRLIEAWTGIIEAHAAARAFVKVWNDYHRRIYEGPDARDPDEAAADWDPGLTGIWNGEYRDYRRRDWSVQITFEAVGTIVANYPDWGCEGQLELTSTSGAFGRITQYREYGCRSPNATVTLERTAADRMRFHWTGRDRLGSLAGSYAGNLRRQ